MFTLRFDMRAPDGAAPTTDLYAAAVDMCSWAVTALREAQGPYRIFTLDEAAAYIRNGRPLPLLPLCGGVPPDLAWPYLERAVMAAERV